MNGYDLKLGGILKVLCELYDSHASRGFHMTHHRSGVVARNAQAKTALVARREYVTAIPATHSVQAR